ncbi:MAG TPA: YceI family protein [Acetobacteraceae bacterium]|nr:YceI family protein [Acetobacteraceae bacterium]
MLPGLRDGDPAGGLPKAALHPHVAIQGMGGGGQVAAGGATAWRYGPAALALLACLVPFAARAAERYPLDPRYGSIAVTVRDLGLFHSTATFARYAGRLTLDLADPAATRIAVIVAAESLRMSWAGGATLMRSAAFLDVAQHKVIRFESQAVTADGPGRYLVRGQLELRGVTRPIVFAARLKQVSQDPATGRRVENFALTGHLDRRDFGMTADPLVIANQVAIAIEARVTLGPAAPGG